MTKLVYSLVTALGLCAGPAMAATIKVGIVGPFSGPFAHYGPLFKSGVEAYVANQGGKLSGHTIEFIYRDTGGPNPTGTKGLVQELIVKDKVDYLGGFVFTPNAMAAAPLIQEAKVPTVIFLASTSEITEKSNYFVRTSYTMWQLTKPIASVVYNQGIRKMVTAVSDYAPGVDAEKAFKTEFEKLGGTVVETIRMPVRTTDFTPFAQRIKASGAKGAYIFLPGGPPNLGFVKAFNENGLRQAGIEFFGTAETDEYHLQQFGDAAIGLTTSYHYSAAHESKANKDFQTALAKHDKAAVANSTSVSAWDGMFLIHKMIDATGGSRNGDKAIASVSNLQWESPRGPVQIDPKTRHITQNVYLRKVERAPSGLLINREIQNLGAQGDTGLGQ